MFGGPGTTVDWLIKMRRLPSALMLDAAIGTGKISSQALTNVGRMLARFYRMQQCIEFEPPAYVACMISKIRTDRDELLAPDLELAFLWMECARLGHAWVGEAILNAYRDQSGDPIARQLFDFYCSRRATVRAKLVAWHLRDPTVSALADWRTQTTDYLQLAQKYCGLSARLG